MSKQCCNEMSKHLDDGEVAICYTAKYREYGIKILDGGSAKQLINFCPWCGRKSPEGLRDEWFSELDRMGFEPSDSRIPKEYLSEEWWDT